MPYYLRKWPGPCDPREWCFGEDHGPDSWVLPWRWYVERGRPLVPGFQWSYQGDFSTSILFLPPLFIQFDVSSDRVRALSWVGTTQRVIDGTSHTFSLRITKVPSNDGSFLDQFEAVGLIDGTQSDNAIRGSLVADDGQPRQLRFPGTFASGDFLSWSPSSPIGEHMVSLQDVWPLPYFGTAPSAPYVLSDADDGVGFAEGYKLDESQYSTLSVTTLASTGTGSFADRLQVAEASPTTPIRIVFNVVGEIVLPSVQTIRKDNLIILGPNPTSTPGITLKGWPLHIEGSHNVWLENFTVDVDTTAGTNLDCIEAFVHTVSGREPEGIVLYKLFGDNYSDECFSITNAVNSSIVRCAMGNSVQPDELKTPSLLWGSGVGLLSSFCTTADFRPYHAGTGPVWDSRFYNYSNSYATLILDAGVITAHAFDVQHCKYRAGPRTQTNQLDGFVSIRCQDGTLLFLEGNKKILRGDFGEEYPIDFDDVVGTPVQQTSRQFAVSKPPFIPFDRQWFDRLGPTPRPAKLQTLIDDYFSED